MHLPTSQTFIDSPKTPISVRRECIQLLIDRTKSLIENKANLDITTRVIASISLPDLWNSQITIFFGDEYFSSFFDRNSESQKWLLLAEKGNLEKEWRLNIPGFMKVKGYKQEITDEYNTYVNELWFIGELE